MVAVCCVDRQFIALSVAGAGVEVLRVARQQGEWQLQPIFIFSAADSLYVALRGVAVARGALSQPEELKMVAADVR